MEELIDAIEGGNQRQKFRLWKPADGGQCYVLPAEASPRDPSDELLVESDNPATLVSAALNKCKPEDKPEQQPRPESRPVATVPVTSCDWILPAGIEQLGDVKGILSYVLGIQDKDGNEIDADWIAGGQNAIGVIIGYLTRWIAGAGDAIFAKLESMVSGNQCASPQLIGQRLQIAVFNFLSGFVGDALAPLKTPLAQHSQFLCPVDMPGIQDATLAYLANTISADTWRCWVRAANGRDALFQEVAEAQRSKLSDGQIASLLLRKKLTPDQFKERLREKGYLKASDAQEIRELAKYIPGPGDLIRFMVRDTENADIVKRFNLDSGFTENYRGQLREQAESQGIDEETARAYWRAHWSIPGPQQLIAMYQRLRGRPPGSDEHVSREDVETALRQQDILPHWIPRIMATSAARLRQVDVRRAYFNGSIDEQQLETAIREQGFDDRDTAILLRYHWIEKRLHWADSKYSRQFGQGAINESELRAEVTSIGAEDVDVQAIMARGQSAAKSSRRAACLKSIKRRFMLAEFDLPTAQSKAISQGVDPQIASEIVAGWQCERDARGKQFSISQLCKLLDQGIITGAEMVHRLEALGWDRADAVKIYAACSTDIDTRRKKADQVRLRREEADEMRRRRAVAQAAKALQRETEQMAKRAQRLQQSQTAREKSLIDSGAKWSAVTGADVAESVMAVKSVYYGLRKSTPHPVEEILRAIRVAVKDPEAAASGDLLGSASRILEAGQISD